MFYFFFHKIVKKIIGWKHLVLIFSLLITPLFILGCTCSKDEEPQVEQQSTVQQPTEKPEVEKRKEPVEIPKSVESPKESYTEEPGPESTKRDEADQVETPQPTPEVIIKTIPGGENSHEEEYGIGPEEREEFEKQLLEADPCSQECVDEFKLCQEDCRQEVHPDEVPSCISDCTSAVIDCDKQCQANR